MDNDTTLVDGSSVQILFGKRPADRWLSKVELYNAIETDLRAMAGEWGLVATVDNRTDLERWRGVSRRRGWEISQRRNQVTKKWDIWVRWPVVYDLGNED